MSDLSEFYVAKESIKSAIEDVDAMFDKARKIPGPLWQIEVYLASPREVLDRLNYLIVKKE